MKLPWILFNIALASTLFHQQDTDDIGSSKDSEQANAADVQLTMSIFKNMFKKVELPDETLARIHTIIDENVPDLVAARKNLLKQLSAEERYQYQGHLRVARAGSFSVDFAENYALKKLKLGPERLASYRAAKEKARYEELNINNQIVSMLTADQISKIPFFDRQRQSKRSSNIRFPNMKTESDFREIKKYLESIDSVVVKNLRLTDRVVRVDLDADTELRKALEEFKSKGIDLFEGYEFESRTGDAFPELSRPQKKSPSVDKNQKSKDKK